MDCLRALGGAQRAVSTAGDELKIRGRSVRRPTIATDDCVIKAKKAPQVHPGHRASISSLVGVHTINVGGG